jgi:hypothetical protein
MAVKSTVSIEMVFPEMPFPYRKKLPESMDIYRFAFRAPQTRQFPLNRIQ